MCGRTNECGGQDPGKEIKTKNEERREEDIW